MHSCRFFLKFIQLTQSFLFFTWHLILRLTFRELKWKAMSWTLRTFNKCWIRVILDKSLFFFLCLSDGLDFLLSFYSSYQFNCFFHSIFVSHFPRLLHSHTLSLFNRRDLMKYSFSVRSHHSVANYDPVFPSTHTHTHTLVHTFTLILRLSLSRWG